jgi:hypothetical protein
MGTARADHADRVIIPPEWTSDELRTTYEEHSQKHVSNFNIAISVGSIRRQFLDPAGV